MTDAAEIAAINSALSDIEAQQTAGYTTVGQVQTALGTAATTTAQQQQQALEDAANKSIDQQVVDALNDLLGL